MRHFLALFIAIYRRFISPKKGFSCAHNHVHGQGSCSDWALDILKDKGAHGLFVELPVRIQQCNAASELLKNSKKNETENNNERSKIDKCCIPAEIASCWILGP